MSPPLAVSKQEASALLGVSVRFFDDHLRHQIPVALVGRRRLYPVSGISDWLDAHAVKPIDWIESSHAV